MAAIPYAFFQDSDGQGFHLLPFADANGATIFTELGDVPATYAGQSLKHVRVNNAATALEFVVPTFLQLSDTPANFTSAAGKYVLVNSAGTALEFAYPSGATDGNDATAGKIGEYKETVVQMVDSVSLVTATAKTIASISLTAGDWDVEGMVLYNRGVNTSITLLTQGTSLTNNTFGAVPTYTVIPSDSFVPTADPGYNVPARRVSVAATQTVYLIGRASFAVSTMGGYGFIRARRIR